MTPKEKAKDLVDKINNGLWKDRGISVCSEIAIYCALIAVNEILEVIIFNKYDDKYWEEEEYWQEVRKEIEKI